MLNDEEIYKIKLDESNVVLDSQLEKWTMIMEMM
jgi:hypothetical protein